MSSDIILRITPGKGEGIFALHAFERGDVVLTGILENTNVANHSHASQLGARQFGFHAGLTSKFNHSCAPNCGIRLNASGAHDFVAMKSIAEDEETTFDYAMRNFEIEHFTAECSCGAPNCRHHITGWRDLPSARKAAYTGFVAPYLLDMDAVAMAG